MMWTRAILLTLCLIISNESSANPLCFVSCSDICSLGNKQAALICPLCKCCPPIKCRYCMFGYVLARDQDGCVTCRCKWPM